MSKWASWGLFVLVLLGAYAFAAPTSLGGPASYVIVDGTSMEPTYHHGDLVVAYRREAYEIGDTIVYDAPVESQFDVIHRITELAGSGYITQGDNRNQPDGWIAPHASIHGSALFHIPHGGDIVALLRRPMVFAALAAGLVTLDLLKRDEKKKLTAEASQADGQASPLTDFSDEDAMLWTARQ